MKERWVTAHGPATIANLGPGFDIFGVALEGFGDTVNARLRPDWDDIRLTRIEGCDGRLPMDDTNVAVAAPKKLLELLGINTMGVEMTLHKFRGIGTGTGGSASSIVAGLLAVNALLEKPLEKDDPRMLEATLYGEAVAIRKPHGHADNVWPSLLGRLVFVKDTQSLIYERIKVNDDAIFVVITPDVVVETAMAREALSKAPYHIDRLIMASIAQASASMESYQLFETSVRFIDEAMLADITREGGNVETVERYIQGIEDLVIGFLANDLARIARGISADGIVTPVRAQFIPGFARLCSKGLDNGALAMGIAGSGPSVFGLADSLVKANLLGWVGVEVFAECGVPAKYIVARVDNNGGSVHARDVDLDLRDSAAGRLARWCLDPTIDQKKFDENLRELNDQIGPFCRDGLSPETLFLLTEVDKEISVRRSTQTAKPGGLPR